MAIGNIVTGQQSVFASLTGPGGGLTTVNPSQKHLSTSDPDVDYIDIMDAIPGQVENQGKAPGLCFSLLSLITKHNRCGKYDWKL